MTIKKKGPGALRGAHSQFTPPHNKYTVAPLPYPGQQGQLLTELYGRGAAGWVLSPGCDPSGTEGLLPPALGAPPGKNGSAPAGAADAPMDFQK